MKSELTSKLISIEKLELIVARLRKRNKTIIWTNGCFDILHVGHVEYLALAKALGDVLIVGLNSDFSVKLIKGDKRPLFNVRDRAKILSALIYIDYVTIFDELSPIGILQLIKPDFYVKGGDYNIETIDKNERQVIESYGGKITFIPKIEGISTSNIIMMIKEL